MNERIEYLEAENRRLRLREKQSSKMLKMLIAKLPMAAVALGPEMRVVYANQPFVALTDHQGRQLAEQVPALEDADLRTLVSAEMMMAAEATHNTGREIEGSDITIEGRPYVLSSFSVAPRELTLLLLRPMYDPTMRSEEMARRLDQTVDRNMKMIQQIAFLLGEEASESAKSIGSVIRMLQMPQGDE